MCAPLNESRIRIRWHWLTVKCVLHQALFQYLRLADFGRWRRNCSEGNAAIRMAIRRWGGDLRRVMQWHWLMRRCWSDVGHETAQAMPGVLVVDGKIDPVLMARGTVRNSTGSSFLRKRVPKRLFYDSLTFCYNHRHLPASLGFSGSGFPPFASVSRFWVSRAFHFWYLYGIGLSLCLSIKKKDQ